MSVFNQNSKFFICSCVVFCLFTVFGLFGKVNAAGSLDSTFGAGGVAFARVGTTSIGNELAIQTDGKIVVVGYTPFEAPGGASDFAVARFNQNGTLDISFDGDGKVVTPVGTDLDIANTVAIQPDGKIVVAGITRVGIRDDFSLVRYNPNGSLDTSFDGDGKVITSIGDGDDSIDSIVIQSDGKIVVAGDSQLVVNSSTYFALARYNTDGSLDTSFDGDGKLTTFIRNTPNFDSAHKIALQPDGKILAAGTSFPDLNQDIDFALVRYNANGSLDTSFDGDGKLTTRVSPTYSGAASIALQPDGKILAAGNSSISLFNDDCAVIRYNTDGSLDTSFDGDGKVYISFGNLIEALGDVAIQPDGKIVAAGFKSNNSGSPTDEDIVVARLNTNGSLDTTFDVDGKVITQIPPYGSRVEGLKILPNGKIITAGSISAQGDAEFVVTRYMADLKTADFDGDTKTDVSIFRPSNGQWWVSRSSDNSNFALQFGVATDKPVPLDYTGDGKTDVAVYRPSTGEWYILRSDDLSFYAFPFGISTDVPVPADYDGDGRGDPAVYRSSNSTFYILKSSGGLQITPFGVTSDRAVPADYDGDGKTDVSIYRSPGGNGEWWINRSTGGTLILFTASASAQLMPADYTGDSKADLAFFIGASTTWNILRSDDFTFYSVQFGQVGDTLAPGDYDGDGKFDTATFRPSNNTWNVSRSSNGSLFQQTFGTSGDVPIPSVFVR
jgi:uncharacterized delta-60 repeat protein